MEEDILELLLMCKDHAVLRFLYDPVLHTPVRILELVDRRYAPTALLMPDHAHTISRGRLADWWRSRAIPVERDRYERLREHLGVTDTAELLEECNALSLSDRYWVKAPDDARTWAEVNFFDNGFSDDLGLVTLGESSSAFVRRSPNASLGGMLRKMWTVEGGERVLLKAGRGQANQEPYNELAATRLHERVLAPGDYVPYSIEMRDGVAYSRCANMLGPDEELVPTWDLRRAHTKTNNENLLGFYLRVTGEELGIDGAAPGLCAMVACDYIIGNADRHWNNFGVVRNAETREFLRLAPIFDSGGSLWCSVGSLDAPNDFAYGALPFLPDSKDSLRQVRMFKDPASWSWLDAARLDGFADDVRDILGRNPALSAQRVDQVARQVAWRSEQVRTVAALARAGA